MQVDCISLNDTTQCSQVLKCHLTSNSFMVVCVNIRSIKNNFDLFLAFVSALNISVDVCVLTECWTTENIPPPDMHGFNKYWTKVSLNQNDGVVVYVRCGLVANVCEPVFAEGNCLLVTLEPEYTLICIYRPPCFRNTKTFLDSLDKVLTSTRTKNIILVGDVNINIMPENLTCNANDYLDLMALHGLKQGINIPTRINTCIDHIMIKCKSICKTVVFEQQLTDHSPILLYIGQSNIVKKAIERNKFKINYNMLKKQLTSFNWTAFYNITDTNTAADQLMAILLKHIKDNTSITNVPNKYRPLKPWITKGVVKCIRKRDKLHKKAKEAPDNMEYQEKFLKYRNVCNFVIKSLKVRYYREKLNSCKGNIKETWKTIKEICDISRNREPVDELINLDISPKKSLNKVNSYFTSIGNKLANQILSNIHTYEENLASQAKNSNSPLKSMSFAPTDPSEVRGIVLGLRLHSAPGWDQITVRILKESIATLAPPIAFLCNLSLETGIFPIAFKKGVVCPIYKSGEKSEPSNYRPISLLTTLSKILEKMVNKRVMAFLEKNRLISRFQFGFREAKSTEDAVLALTTNIVTHLDNGDKCVGIFLDLQKAFDTVSIPILLTRLENNGIRGVVLDWFTDYLTGRSQCVRVAGVVSDCFGCKFGVPQGSTLGPSLFLIYVNELSNVTASGNCEVTMFADDTVLIFHGRTWDSAFKEAEMGLSKVTAWLEDNLLSLNTSKTKYMCFSKTTLGKPPPECKIKIHTHPCNRGVIRDACVCTTLVQVVTIKYLGVIVDDRLNWNPHITTLTARVRKLMFIFKNLRQMAEKNLLIQTYQALCECLLRYCICAWGGAASTILLQAERAQRAVLKVILHLPFRHPTSDVYRQASVLSVRKKYIYEILRRYHKKHVPYLPPLHKRTIRYPVPRLKTAFGQRHVHFYAPYVYNKLSKIHKVNKMNNNKFKNVLLTWLGTLEYLGTENLLKVDK